MVDFMILGFSTDMSVPSVGPIIFVTAMLRPGSNFKIHQSAPHNRIRLKYTPRELTQRPKWAAAVGGHHMCGTIVQTRLPWVSSKIVGVGLNTEVDGKVVLWKVTQTLFFSFFLDVVFTLGEMHNETQNERGRHQGMNGMLQRSTPANEFKCETSSGHFVMRYGFRKI